MNKIFILGNVGKEPEFKKINENQCYCRFSVAVSEKIKRQDGPMQEFTTWFNIVAWSKLAENCSKYLGKGTQVLIEGKMKSSQYEKDGKKLTSWDLVASNVQFLNRVKEEEKSNEPDPLEDIPF